MIQSESVDKLQEALSKAQGEIKGAKKDSTNPHFKAKYADLESTWEACRAPLSKYGLSVSQWVFGEHGKIGVTTQLGFADQWMRSSVEMDMSQASNPQIAGSIITYLRRYSLQAAVGIAPEDDDANAASPKPAAEPSPATTPAAAPGPGAKQAQAPFPLLGADALRQKLNNYAADAADVGKYPKAKDAIFAWTKYVKDGVEKGFYSVASMKHEWQLKAAIIKAEADLGVIPDEDEPPVEDMDIPF